MEVLPRYGFWKLRYKHIWKRGKIKIESYQKLRIRLLNYYCIIGIVERN